MNIYEELGIAEFAICELQTQLSMLKQKKQTILNILKYDDSRVHPENGTNESDPPQTSADGLLDEFARKFQPEGLGGNDD